MEKIKTILLTGVTGQIGSAMAPFLQKKGYRVLYLVRPNKTKSAEERLKETLPIVRDGLDIVLEGDVTQKYAGLTDGDVSRWNGEVDAIVHAAAAISFEDADSESTHRTNLDGTRYMLELADALNGPNFHYVSTAYVSGSARVFGETDLRVGQTSFNEYEKSKIAAEELVRSWKGGNFSIHRLGTVLGDSKTGEVKTFHSYYGFFLPFHSLKQTFLDKWKKDPESCRGNGVEVASGDSLSIPLYIDCSETAILNLTTVDWVAETLAKLLAVPCVGQTYHLTNPNPPKVKWVIETSLAHMNITGVRYDKQDENLSPLMQRVQNGLDRGINKYRQYIKHGTEFLVGAVQNALGADYTPPPVIDENLLKLMLDYAQKVNFGRSK